MKTVVGLQPWPEDPKCLPIPWREVQHKKKLKLAVFYDDGMVRPTPPVRRALRETVDKLKTAGFEIVEWDTKLHEKIYEVLGEIFLSDGGITVQKMLDPTGEPWQDDMIYFKHATEIGTNAMWQLHLRRSELLKAYLDQWNSREGLDALIGPTMPPAVPEKAKFGGHGAYTGVYNVLDYPATSFPCGVYVDKELDKSCSLEPLNETDAQVQKLCKCLWLAWSQLKR